MAHNLSINQLKDPGSATIVKLPRYEYYIEWWHLGTNAADIESGQFRTSNLKHFIRVFKKHTHLSLVYLRRIHDDKVLYDKRTGARQV